MGLRIAPFYCGKSGCLSTLREVVFTFWRNVALMLTIFHLCGWGLLAAQDAPAPPAGGLQQLMSGPWIPLVMVMVLFYLLMIRPERRKRAELTRMLSELTKNDRIVTVGGILGTVVNAQKGIDEVTIKVDESNNTRLRVQRSAIARVLSDDGSPLSKET